MESAAAIGRVGAKTMTWFIGASLLSLSLGLVMVHIFQPGVGLTLPPPPEGTAAIATEAFSLANFITHLVPKSIVEAMANNEILQIVVFSVFVGTAISAIEGRTPAVLALTEQAAEIMLKVTGYVMLLAPLAVFAAICSTVASQGPGVLLTYLKFVAGFYAALLLLWAILLAAAAVLLRGRVGPLLGAIREPVLLAFSTASSEAAYPKLLDALERIGLPRRIVSFVLPLGYSFNLDGSMMYCTFATLFIRPALRHRAFARPAGDAAAAPDGHQQGHGRRAARLAGGDRRGVAAVRPAAGGAAVRARRRPPARHGPQRHQYRRQFGGDRRGVALGRAGRGATCNKRRAAAKAL